jgi:hypothetical protein
MDVLDRLKNISSVRSTIRDSIDLHRYLANRIMMNVYDFIPPRDTRVEVACGRLATVSYLSAAVGFMGLVFRSLREPKCSQPGLLAFVSAFFSMGSRFEDLVAVARRQAVNAQTSSLIESMSWG